MQSTCYLISLHCQDASWVQSGRPCRNELQRKRQLGKTKPQLLPLPVASSIHIRPGDKLIHQLCLGPSVRLLFCSLPAPLHTLTPSLWPPVSRWTQIPCFLSSICFMLIYTCDPCPGSDGCPLETSPSYFFPSWLSPESCLLKLASNPQQDQPLDSVLLAPGTSTVRRKNYKRPHLVLKSASLDPSHF